MTAQHPDDIAVGWFIGLLVGLPIIGLAGVSFYWLFGFIFLGLFFDFWTVIYDV